VQQLRQHLEDRGQRLFFCLVSYHLAAYQEGAQSEPLRRLRLLRLLRLPRRLLRLVLQLEPLR
jgi:hypothetical protein